MASHLKRPRTGIVHRLPPEIWDEVLANIRPIDVIRVRAAGPQYLKSIAEAHPGFWRDISAGWNSNVHLFKRRCETAAAVEGGLIDLKIDFRTWCNMEFAPEAGSQRVLQRTEVISQFFAIAARIIGITRSLCISANLDHFRLVEPCFWQAAPRLEDLKVDMRLSTYGNNYRLPDNLFLGLAPLLVSIETKNIYPPRSPQVRLPSVRNLRFSGHWCGNGTTPPTHISPISFQALLPGVSSLKLSGDTLGNSAPALCASLTSSASITDVELDFYFDGENARLCNLLPTRHVSKFSMTTNADDIDNITAFSRKLEDLSNPLSVTLSVTKPLEYVIEVTFNSHEGLNHFSRTLAVCVDQSDNVGTIWDEDEPEAVRANVTEILKLLSTAAGMRNILALHIDAAFGANLIASCLQRLPEASTLVLMAHKELRYNWLSPCDVWSPDADAVQDIRLAAIRNVRIDIQEDLEANIRLCERDLDTIITLEERLPLGHPVRFSISPGADFVIEQFCTRSKGITKRFDEVPNTLSNL